jgi:hypothetical protein
VRYDEGTMRCEVLAGVMVAAMLAATSVVALPKSTKLIDKFNDWTFYSHRDSRSKLCFAIGMPKTREPPAVRREPPFFYVSAWPNEGVKSEVSVKIGYAFRKGSDVTVRIGKEAFKLFTKDDRAFVADPAEERKLIEVMKKGSSMVVKGVSERGTSTKDTYSLSGIARALQALNAGCS